MQTKHVSAHTMNNSQLVTCLLLLATAAHPTGARYLQGFPQEVRWHTLLSFPFL